MAAANIGFKGWKGNSSTVGIYNPRLHLTTAKENGFEIGANDPELKTVYIGNLDMAVTEDFICILFGQIGPVHKAKIFTNDRTNRYAFVEFTENKTASQCVLTMNDRLLMGREIKVHWAVKDAALQPVIESSGPYHIFVGDLALEVDNRALETAFAPFGEVSDVKVIRDSISMKSKGYGFVSYPTREQAETAMDQMNGKQICGRAIRTNWATRRSDMGSLVQETVGKRPGNTNTSVYVGNMPPNCSESDIRLLFNQFGAILSMRLFPQLGYSFVTFSNRQSAINAINEMSGREFMGRRMKCSWGRGDIPVTNGARHDLPAFYGPNNPMIGALSPSNLSATNAIPASVSVPSYVNLFHQFYQSNSYTQQWWDSYWEQQGKRNMRR